MTETGPAIAGVTIRRRLAVGGMGELFVARQDLPDGTARAVVVKRLFPDADADFRALFAREGDALARLDSPHITRLFERGDDYLVMEFVDGPDLATLLAHRRRRGRAVPLGAALEIILGVARGLRDLHAAGLVHRDVNPANVLIAKRGAVKLADLGVVGVGPDAAARTTVAGLKGTLAYMAPEQLNGQRADQRADIYAAGLVAYEVLTGVAARPAGAVGVAELVAARARTPAPPSSLRPQLPRALDDAVLAALAPSPAARPPTVAAWLQTLEAAGDPGGPKALSALVAKAQPASSRRSTMEVPVQTGLALGDGAASTPPATSGAAPRRRPIALLVAVVAVGALVAVLVFAVVLPDDAAVVAVRDAGVSQPVPDVAPETIAEETVVVASSPSRERRLAELGASRAPRRAPEVATAHTAPDPPPRVPPRVAAQPPARIAIHDAGAGPVYVKGAGARGLATQTTTALADGAHVLTLTGGAPTMTATVRIVAREAALTFSVGAPAGRFYRVRCGAGAEQTTPVRGLRLRGSVRCQLADDAGARMAFKMVEVRE